MLQLNKRQGGMNSRGRGGRNIINWVKSNVPHVSTKPFFQVKLHRPFGMLVWRNQSVTICYSWVIGQTDQNRPIWHSVRHRTRVHMTWRRGVLTRLPPKVFPPVSSGTARGRYISSKSHIHSQCGVEAAFKRNICIHPSSIAMMIHGYLT